MSLPIRSKKNPCAVLCLGADIDMIFPKLHDTCEDDEDQEDARSTWAGKFDEFWTPLDETRPLRTLSTENRLRITMTHGSILFLEGVDFDVSHSTVEYDDC